MVDIHYFTVHMSLYIKPDSVDSYLSGIVHLKTAKPVNSYDGGFSLSYLKDYVI